MQHSLVSELVVLFLPDFPVMKGYHMKRWMRKNGNIYCCSCRIDYPRRGEEEWWGASLPASYCLVCARYKYKTGSPIYVTCLALQETRTKHWATLYVVMRIEYESYTTNIQALQNPMSNDVPWLIKVRTVVRSFWSNKYPLSASSAAASSCRRVTDVLRYFPYI